MKTGYQIELTSRYQDWWRFNITLICGCFNEAGERIDFRTVESRVADVGANLAQCPEGVDPNRPIRLQVPSCARIMLCVYLVAHSFPQCEFVDELDPFAADLKVSFEGRKLYAERLSVNPWSGLSLEVPIAAVATM